MTDFTMPSLGADMEEGTLLEWLVAPGDVVHKGDILAVVDTAKSAVDVESFSDGVVGDLDPEAVRQLGEALSRARHNVSRWPEYDLFRHMGVAVPAVGR